MFLCVHEYIVQQRRGGRESEQKRKVDAKNTRKTKQMADASFRIEEE